MQVQDVMTSEVTSISINAPVKEAIEFFEKTGRRHLPVLDEAEKVVGILSDRDRRTIELTIDTFTDTGYQQQILESPVKNVMKREVISVFPDTNLAEAAKMLVDMKLGALPVISKQKLIGIVSYVDVLNAFSASLSGL